MFSLVLVSALGTFENMVFFKGFTMDFNAGSSMVGSPIWTECFFKDESFDLNPHLN